MNCITKLYNGANLKERAHDRERVYCNRLLTLQGCTTFPTREQDQRPYPRPRISVDSCLNLSHKHNQLWANGREGQVHRIRWSHSITTRTESDQGKVWLMLVGLPSHYKVCGLYGEVLKYHSDNDQSLINSSKFNHLSSTLNMALPFLLKSKS